MKVRRYIAPDIRSALNQVRDAQGPDAVILSQRKVDGGIEVITADGNTGSLIANSPNDRPQIARSRAASNEAYSAIASQSQSSDSMSRVPSRRNSGIPTPEQVVKEPLSDKPDAREKGWNWIGQCATSRTETLWTHEPLLEQMRGELKSLRRMLESQMASLAWGDVGRRHPLQAVLLRKLVRLGVTPTLARRLAQQVPDGLDDEAAWRRVLGLFCRSLPVAQESILAQGGVVALMGPTGVGKTTLIGKLAIRFALKHGRDSVALVTVDNRRIGAFEQLRSFGGLAGLPVWTVGTGQDLREVLDTVYDKQLILIDTAGMGCRDPHLAEQMDVIQGCSPRLRCYVVVSATTDSQGLDQIIGSYRSIDPVGCLITKLDEATSLGAALSAAIEHSLPIAYTSSGQRIPEDLEVAQGPNLVSRAVTIMRQRRKEEDDLFMETMFDGDSAYATG